MRAPRGPRQYSVARVFVFLETQQPRSLSQRSACTPAPCFVTEKKENTGQHAFGMLPTWGSVIHTRIELAGSPNRYNTIESISIERPPTPRQQVGLRTLLDARPTATLHLHRLLVPHDNAMATLAPPAAACCPPAASGEGKHVRLGKTLRCPDCPRTYHNKFSLLVHRRLQHEHPSPYSCNECGLSFPQARSSTTRRLPTTTT